MPIRLLELSSISLQSKIMKLTYAFSNPKICCLQSLSSISRAWSRDSAGTWHCSTNCFCLLRTISGCQTFNATEACLKQPIRSNQNKNINKKKEREKQKIKEKIKLRNNYVTACKHCTCLTLEFLPIVLTHKLKGQRVKVWIPSRFVFHIRIVVQGNKNKKCSHHDIASTINSTLCQKHEVNEAFHLIRLLDNPKTEKETPLLVPKRAWKQSFFLR